MAIVKILNNSMNPLGWKRGDIVEITKEQGVDDLIKSGFVEVISSSENSGTETPLNIGEVEGEDESINCEICGKEAKSAFGLQAHMRSHSKERQVK